MIWLTPFDKIQLAASEAPINITLDRIVLPIVAVIWLIALTAGPGAARDCGSPACTSRSAVFVACAFLSVVLDARYLNHTGDLMLSIKKLPLLVSYVSIFVIVASSVRRSEVPAFMTYSLVLAVICGLEVIYEYHFHQNLFNVWTQRTASATRSSWWPATQGPSLDSLGRSLDPGSGRLRGRARRDDVDGAADRDPRASSAPRRVGTRSSTASRSWCCSLRCSRPSARAR